MHVDFPQPDSPTKAVFFPDLIVKLILFNTVTSYLVGYLNNTSLNYISPLNCY